MYIYNSQWDTTDISSENRVFSSLAVAMIILFFVQLVLIYIFYGLGRAPSQTFGVDNNIEDSSAEAAAQSTEEAKIASSSTDHS